MAAASCGSCGVDDTTAASAADGTAGRKLAPRLGSAAVTDRSSRASRANEPLSRPSRTSASHRRKERQGKGGGDAHFAASPALHNNSKQTKQKQKL